MNTVCSEFSCSLFPPWSYLNRSRYKISRCASPGRHKGWGMKTEMMVFSTGHSGFEKKDFVLRFCLLSPLLSGYAPPHSPLEHWEDATVSQLRPRKFNLRGMLLLPPGGISQGQTGKLLECYTMGDSLQKFHYVGCHR